MKSFKLLFIVALFATLLFNVVFTSQDHTDEDAVISGVDENTLPETETEEVSPGRGISRFLAQRKPKAQPSCDKLPRICRTKGSPGPDCCKKKCVNVMTDRLNCGMCGMKCKYSQICCRGNCVNPSFDKKNCGGCNKRCKRGEFCAYGMCNYA